MKIITRSIFLMLLLSFLLPSGIVYAQPPPISQEFHGTVTLDGSPVPDGTSVTAEMNGRTAGSDSTSGGNYSLTISTISGDNAGDNIRFYVGGLSAGSASLSPGDITEKNLSASTPGPRYTLTINTSGAAGATSGAGSYEEGTTVAITATPDTGSQFDNWSGNIETIADPDSASTTITMNGNYTITANFILAPVTLTMAVNGNGSTSPEIGEHDYEKDAVVDISANPASGWLFDNWTGDVADPNSASTTVTMDTDKTVTANFSLAPEVTLTMAVNGNGSTSPAVGDYTYPIGTVVSIAAIADSGWGFDSWTGDVANPNSAITTVTMDSDKTVTANFSETPTYTLTMTVNGNGSTNPAVGEYAYPIGTVVSIAAIADSGWGFDNWSGDVADPNSTSTTVTMDADKTVTANFSLKEDTTPPFILAISVSNIAKTGADISWVTDEPGDTQVDYWASPGELTPLDETLVTEHLVHLSDLTPATTYSYRVMSRDEAGNLSISGEYTFTTMGLPATFAISDWAISLSEVDTGTEVTISFLLTNTGDLAGSYQVALTVSGMVEMAKGVTLDALASEEITFTTTKDVAGTYLVSVNGLTVSFTVVPPPPAEINWWLIIGIIAGVVLLLILSILLTRRAKEKAEKGPGENVTEKAKALVSAAVGWIYSHQPFKTKEAKEIAKGGVEGAAIMAVREAKKATERAIYEANKAREAERKARQEVERTAGEKARRDATEAKERAKREAEEAKKAIEAEKKVKKEVERAAGEKARREATEARERARREAEEAKKAIEAEKKARLEAERAAGEKARRETAEARERARREAEEAKKAREAEEKARLEAEREAEEKAEKEAEEKAEEKAEKEAEEKAEKEAEEKARREAEEAKQALRQQPSNGLYVRMEGGGVLTVTALAVEKLKEAIRTQTTDPEVGIRLMLSPSKPDQFEMTLEKEKGGDQVVESEGLKILLLRSELAPALEGMVIDCQETPQGVRFTMSKPTSGT